MVSYADIAVKGSVQNVQNFAQYYGVDFEIYPGQDAAVLRLLKSNTGLAGGIWGMMKVSKQFEELSDTIARWFQQQGVLQGVQKK